MVIVRRGKGQELKETGTGGKKTKQKKKRKKKKSFHRKGAEHFIIKLTSPKGL